MSKTNKAGRECPQWCESDHENGRPPYSCERKSPSVQTPGGQLWAALSLGPGDKAEPEVTIFCSRSGAPGTGGYADFTSREPAEAVASALELLADAAPDDHRTLATQLREAAAEAFPQSEPDQEAEAGA